mgnify:FL=1
MKVKKIKFQINKIKLIDNFNMRLFKNNDCLYEIENHIYKFYDKPTMVRFMLHSGVTCGCERRIQNNNLVYYYNNRPANEGQIEFLRNRARALMHITDMNTGIVIKNDCKCKKKRPE